jgi:predicted DNA-binding ArsR family transcriptional regulator
MKKSGNKVDLVHGDNKLRRVEFPKDSVSVDVPYPADLSHLFGHNYYYYPLVKMRRSENSNLANVDWYKVVTWMRIQYSTALEELSVAVHIKILSRDEAVNGSQQLKEKIANINHVLMGKTFFDVELNINTTVIVAELDSSDFHRKGKGVALIVVRTLDENTHDEDNNPISVEACQKDFSLRRNSRVCATYDPADFELSTMTIPIVGSACPSNKRKASIVSPQQEVTTFKKQVRLFDDVSVALEASGRSLSDVLQSLQDRFKISINNANISKFHIALMNEMRKIVSGRDVSRFIQSYLDSRWVSFEEINQCYGLSTSSPYNSWSTNKQAEEFIKSICS